MKKDNTMKYIILQNTVSPYRISLFNKLKENNLDIELLYMTEMEYGRSWQIDYSTMRYPYTIDHGVRKIIRSYEFLWNPKILKRFCNERNCKIILGGSWNMPDVIVTCILKRLGLIKPEIIFWSEANYQTIGSRKRNWLRDALRSFVFCTGEGRIIVPGQMAVKSFEKWGINDKHFIYLPNVIEEEQFLPHIGHQRNCTPIDKQPVFVLPVRLVERIKGIMNFFKAIGSDNINKCQFHVLGNGPDEDKIRRFIEDNNYSGHIHLGGFCNMNQMVDYYLSSDCLILPSFSDPSPLSLVEGCCCSMPILASERCGNHFETIKNGVNGYTFNPDNHNEIKEAFEKLLIRRRDWLKMGIESHKLFEKNFRQDTVLNRFIAELNHKNATDK